MFKIESRVDYGLLIMLEIAKKNKEAMSLSQLGKQLKISPAYLIQIAQLLAQAGLITSKEGVSGGYKLTKTPRAINLLTIIEALEGRLEARCVSSGRVCSHSRSCPGKKAWGIILPNIKTALKKQTLASLLN